MADSKAYTKEVKKEVEKIFTTYLEKSAYRKTLERFAILDEIYKSDEHFDVDALYVQMKNKKYRVSRATVYNTLELLLDCGLVKKHQFGKNQAQFEASYGNKQHDHIICIECNQVIEFCDPRLQQIQDTLEEIFPFEISHHSLLFYGKPKLDKNKNCTHN